MIDIVIIIITLMLSAFFSGMEIAFVTSSRFRTELEKKQGIFSSRIISFFSKNQAQYISTMLVGNNIALVIYGIFTAKVIEPYIEKYITTADYTVLLIQTIVSTLLILVTAEFLPKTVFKLYPNKTLNFFALPVIFFYVIFYPVSVFAMYISRIVLKTVLKVDIKKKNEEIIFGKTALDDFLSEEEEKLHKGDSLNNEIKIFKNALDFSHVKLRECIVPRNEMEAMEVNSDISELSKKFVNTGFSKILIYKETIDNIIGYVHSHEMFKRPKSIKAALGKIIIAPESMPANKLLNTFIQERKNIALVVDEFGGTAGIVTLEDVMEEIFGEIEDEYDNTKLIDNQISENEYIFSGRTEIDFLNEKYNLNIPESEEYETIAGYILNIHTKIPEENEIIESEKFRFIILEVQKPKIEKIKLIKLQE